MNKKTYLIFAISIALAGCGYSDAQNAVKKLLTDPESAKFSDLADGKNTGDVCGMVNAKNKMGGYVGATPFYFSNELQMADFVRTPSDSDFRMLWLEIKTGNFQSKFMELAMECNSSSEWEKYCKTPLPITPNALCKEFKEKPGSIYHALKSKYDTRY